MTRKEFIATLIEKKLKPLLYLIVLAYFVIYLLNVFNNDTNLLQIIFYKMFYQKMMMKFRHGLKDKEQGDLI